MTARDEEERAANEATFREANEQIRRAQREFELPGDRIPFLCECDDPQCRVPILLGEDEYERVREDATCFVVLTGHTGHDEVVAEAEGHAIVRKTGQGGLVAAERNPRKEGL